MLQVVLVVAANQQMRSTTNLLIINLAMADLLFIVFCVPFTATDYVLPFWPFGDVWCKIVQYLIVVTAYASVYTLVLMSLDRFLAVVHPITSMSVSATCIPMAFIIALATAPYWSLNSRIHFNIIHPHLRLGFSSRRFPSGFPTNIVYAILFFPIRVISLVHLIFFY
jgi:hypothetical protein